MLIWFDELYNVKNDPGELNNLINQNEHQTIREELESLLREWLLKIDDPVLH